MWNAIFSWDTLWILLLILYVPACIFLIIIVLLQRGKGTGFAGAFGTGTGADAVFGPKSTKTIMVRITYVSATTFMLIAMIMSIIANKVGRGVAPELVEVEEGATAAAVSGGLEDLGIGTGEIDATRATAPEAPPAAESSEPIVIQPAPDTAQPQPAAAPSEEQAPAPRPEAAPEQPAEQAPPAETPPPDPGAEESGGSPQP